MDNTGKLIVKVIRYTIAKVKRERDVKYEREKRWLECAITEAKILTGS
jgi:hypothetical protein